VVIGFAAATFGAFAPALCKSRPLLALAAVVLLPPLLLTLTYICFVAADDWEGPPDPSRRPRGRGVASNPTNRFEKLSIEAEVERAQFEAWIAPDIVRIEAAVDRALEVAGVEAAAIDRVFLTGGTSLTPRIRRLFVDRFGEERIASGGELTSIAHGLALIGQQKDLAAWAA